MTATQHLYLDLGQLTDPERVLAALRAADIHPDDYRPVSRNNTGHIVTDLLAQGIWDHESGAQECQGNCPPERRHLTWDQLTQDQKVAFTANYARFLTNCTSDELLLNTLLENEDLFEQVALS